ncbi:hypothetical protein [Thalassobacillus sp. CUG 92003]|uniref:hypothetical protein n=1 Tax=Thalassobacillus sp. CUG 92003 TaxID=2736641 RepID=UPI0015E7452F|nr:hypothetical protein [Thalassobacillus sp. CUG 92003]
MGMVLLFLILGTASPFLFLEMKKTYWAVGHTILLIGMWMYFFETMFVSAPTAFSILWIMFYASLVVSHVAWVMFTLYTVKEHQAYQKSFS